MNCPTCSHEMNVLGCRVTDLPLHFCVVCGTHRMCDGTVVVPLLVERCRKFAAEEYAAWDANAHQPTIETPDRWRTIGIAEAINKPEERP